MVEQYDLVIIGGGPAGMAAGVFAARYRLKTIILEKSVVGGQPAVAERIENFPGFPELDGWDFATRLEKHVTSLDVPILESGEVRGVEPDGKGYRVVANKGSYETKTVLVATGGRSRLLGVPGEEKFSRRGVHYCAQCAGFGYEGKRIAVVGGGESALLGALYLSGIGREVFLLHRREGFRGEKVLQERIDAAEKIRQIRGTVVEEILGEKTLSGICLRNVKSGERTTLEVDALFVYVGCVPNTAFINAEKDAKGFLRVNLAMETTLPGVFACGNAVREDAQIISAMGEGAVAVLSAAEYITAHLDI
ncbi:MAG: FAD-dependent oxidoreductase [Deltaproteobacteria bacterium]|nr:FAD-dependent oxidoreductase [Deltaproteobacteria bacterium]